MIDRTERCFALRPKRLRDQFRHDTVRTRTLSRQLNQGYRARVSNAVRHLASLSRVLEGVSYRAVLERGFALVRGSDGIFKRRSKNISAGERLALIFADGTAEATAGAGAPQPNRKLPQGRGPLGGQGTLF